MMRAGRKCPVTTLATLAAGLFVATLAGCYRPNVLEGGFKCADAGKQCPDGFRCDPVDNMCRQMLLDGGTDRDGKDAPDAMDAPDAPDTGQCFMPKPSCDPSDAGASCDPFCQSGCASGPVGCRQKCSVNKDGGLTCNDVVPMPLKTELQPCTIVNGGTAAQTDVCAPGLVCLEDACGGTGFGRCFKFCRNDDDCPESQCSKPLTGSTWRVCDVPNMDTCNPTPSNSGCVGGQGCYIAISRPTRTVCDCPGSKTANEDCFGSRSCFPGLLCVDPTGGAATICLRVCQLSKNGSDCPGGTPGSCHMYSGNTGGTMVNATFGFCF